MEKEILAIHDSVSDEDCNIWDDYVILSRRSMELIRAAQARAAVARAGEESAGAVRQGQLLDELSVATCLATASASTMDGPAGTHYGSGAAGLLR
jgi:hypothetical protein